MSSARPRTAPANDLPRTDELRLRATGSNGTSDYAARFDEHATVGRLADALERLLEGTETHNRTLHRTTRGSRVFDRSAALRGLDLRSGDAVALVATTALHRRSTAMPMARLRVVSGPDVGHSFDLDRGESFIGRSRWCTVVLHDAMASRRHVRLQVTDIVEISDAGSTNGIEINGEPATGLHRLRDGDRFTLGDTTLVLDLLDEPQGAATGGGNRIGFNRPPRLARPMQSVSVALPAKPEPPATSSLPWIAALAPLVMGGVMFALTRNILGVLFMALSPVMVVGNHLENLRSQRRHMREREIEYDAVLADRIATLDTALDAECRARFVLAPSAHELLGVVTELSPRLWERRPGDADFGSLRVGVGPQPSSIRVEVPSNAGRDHQRAMCELADRYRLLPASPVTVNPRVSGPVGITGPEPHARALARSLVLQAAILHSPDELLIGAVLTVGADEEWGWLKWLPHADAHRSPFGGPLCSSGAAAGAELLHALQGVIDERLESTNGSRTALRSVPRVLLLVEGDAGIERSRFSSVLANGSQVGIDLLWMADDTRRLPNDCRTIVVVDAHGSLLDVTDADTGDELQDIALEGLTPDRAETIARGIAPVVDISVGGDRATELPDAVNLADLLGGVEVLDDPAAIADRWRQAAGSQGSLIAPVGSHVDGTMFVDLRLDGPHGLVAGTTGSGKSEFLQTFIASLAAGQPPNRINFLLVDYKGGSAFGDLATRLENGEIVGEGLHHTVGLITDLSPVLAERALISLRAELQHRERLLSRYRAKDLVEMERRAGPNTPANLVIIVDEFAALAREVPAFVAGIVDIAQRGRSLGLHLLLATQRPQGVITANIRANTNLRVALRMATEDESEDVVGSRVAGRIDRSTPGRAVMRRGPSDLVTFQSAYVGAVSAPTSRSALEIGDFALTGTVWHSPDESATGEERAETDLRRLVRTINAAADAERMPRPRRPWLDPLPMTVDLLALPPSEDDSRLVIGLADHPQFQSQDVATFRPDEEGSVLVYGIGGSGKTVALRTIGVACGLAGNRAPVHVYGIDFAGRGLDLLRPLPHVGEIVAGEDYERLTGLLTSLTDEITTRAERFSIARASNLREFRTSPVGDPRLRRIVVLLDGFDNFQSAYERIDRGRWTEMMSRLVADGRRLGIHFVLTGTRRSSFPIAVSSQMSARFILRLAGDDEYQSVGAEPRWFDDDTPPGRGRIDGTEVQFAVTGGASATALEAAAIERLAAELRQVSGTDEAPRIRVLPATLTRDELDSSLGGAWLITERFEPASPALDLNVLIAGRPRSGRSTALAELLLLVRRHGVDPGVYAAAPGPGPLRDARSFDQLAEDLAEGLSGVVFIDGLDRLGGHACEYRFQDAVRNEQLLVVATADSTAARSFDQTIRAVRSRCDVLVLQPDAETDGDLLGTPLPRSARRYPPGRGLSTLAPGLVVQVAVSVDA